MRPMDWLKTAIEDAGGVPAVAEAAGVSEEHLYNILARRKRITPRVAAKLAPVLSGVARACWVTATMGETFAQKESPKRRRQRQPRRRAREAHP